MDEWLKRVLTDVCKQKHISNDKAKFLFDKIIAIIFKKQYIKDSDKLLTEGTTGNEHARNN